MTTNKNALKGIFNVNPTFAKYNTYMRVHKEKNRSGLSAGLHVDFANQENVKHVKLKIISKYASSKVNVIKVISKAKQLF